MNPVGNDVVWLADPANIGRYDDLRLIRRILTLSERKLVESAPDADRSLWSLWAAKEAAYKVWSRLIPETVFSPASFEVTPDVAEGGRLSAGAVTFHGEAIAVTWGHGTDWVHAVAARDQSTVLAKVEQGSGNLTDAVRALAVRTLVDAGMPHGTVEGRPPRYLAQGQETGVELSLSHDGPYLAVALRCRRWTATLQP